MSNRQLETAKAWLKSASYDLEQAQRTGRDSIERGMLCYHAQQCAEKSVKALLIAKGVEFKKSHDSVCLCKLMSAAQVDFPFSEELATLSAFLTARYPGDVSDIEESDRIVAAKMAESIYRWAGTFLS